MSAPAAVRDLGQRARAAAARLGAASTAEKNTALLNAADLMLSRTTELLAANRADVEAAQLGGMDAGPLDRLRLTETRIAGMADGLRGLAALPDPVGEVLDGWRRPNGLQIERVRVPLGVVAIIYENRPNVTSDAAGICLKSGNVAVLRGSASALHSNQAIVDVLRDAATKAGLPADCVLLVDDVRHEAAVELMQLTEFVDCLIPRGGASLIQSIRDHATVPVIIDGDGNCHVYVDAHADLEMALDIVVNAKTSRPSVCNAAESLVRRVRNGLLHYRRRPGYCSSFLSTMCTTSAENPRLARNRDCFARSSNVVGRLPNFFFHTARAASTSLSFKWDCTAASAVSDTPFSRNSWRMRAAPNLRRRTVVSCSTKRTSDSQPRFSRSSSRG
jgi:hypothetical protein